MSRTLISSFPTAAWFPERWRVSAAISADIRPAATMMVAGLIEEEMKVEIELTALHQS